MDSIFHYCSVDTFRTIISNKSLRLSDLNKTNDYMEKKWISKLIEDALISEFKNLGINIQLREDYWYDEGIENHITFLNEMMNYFFQKPSYISCFSKIGDKLSQWRAYGDNGTGIAVGFDYKTLKKIKRADEDIAIEAVLYNRNKQLKAIQSAITYTVAYMVNLFESDSAKETDNFNEYFVDEFDAFCEVICDYLNPLSCYIKNPAFKEEEEVRIFYSPNLYEDMTEFEVMEYFDEHKDISGYILQPIKFQVRNNQLIGYVDMNFEHFVKDNIINEVIIGPSSKVTEEDVFYLMLSNGYNARDVKILKSEATYR